MAAGKWLPTAELTGSGRAVLEAGEIEVSLVSSVDLLCEGNPSFPPLKAGLLILTTHRLIWVHQPIASSIPLASVTHIFPPSHNSLKTMFSSPRLRFQAMSTLFTLVLRAKTDPHSFYAKISEAWRGRAWETHPATTTPSSGSVEGTCTSLEIKMPVVGLSGILRKEQEMWESTDKSLQDAFQDLNALMVLSSYWNSFLIPLGYFLTCSIEAPESRGMELRAVT